MTFPPEERGTRFDRFFYPSFYQRVVHSRSYETFCERSLVGIFVRHSVTAAWRRWYDEFITVIVTLTRNCQVTRQLHATRACKCKVTRTCSLFPQDPRTQDYFLIGSPWGCFSILAFYLYFVQDLGPNIMAKRKPFNLNRIIQIYDLIQIISCSYIFYKVKKNQLSCSFFSPYL